MQPHHPILAVLPHSALEMGSQKARVGIFPKLPPHFIQTLFRRRPHISRFMLSISPSSASSDAALLMQTHLALALLPLGAPHTLCPPPGSFLPPFTAHFHSYTHMYLLACGPPDLFEN